MKMITQTTHGSQYCFWLQPINVWFFLCSGKSVFIISHHYFTSESLEGIFLKKKNKIIIRNIEYLITTKTSIFKIYY